MDQIRANAPGSNDGAAKPKGLDLYARYAFAGKWV
jgi:hypothetical protein